MMKRKNQNNNGELITVNQACEAANLGTASIRRLAKEAGAVRRIGRNYRINREVLFDYIEQTCTG